jgi:hypothetical protein
MKRRRRFLLIGIVIILTLLIAALGWQNHRMRVQYERVKLGMTLEEVEEILGPHDIGISMRPQTLSANWDYVGGRIAVFIGPSGKVTAKWFGWLGIWKHEFDPNPDDLTGETVSNRL